MLSLSIASGHVKTITRYGGGRGEMHDVIEAIFAPDYEKQGIGVVGFAKNDWREMFLLIMLGAVGVAVAHSCLHDSGCQLGHGFFTYLQIVYAENSVGLWVGLFIQLSAMFCSFCSPFFHC
ncbi:hypothetical protein NC653_003127 [Populus alba x Populus x berolinensis]|uniref:Uncharacterized protein n=1 Tax=Populus alba x Populus x berolinensis TaxID=444605 RepID=A0AAD6WIR8_9ROSI|nr:hypothetical protein NC653_003127 [Populus alba x Populus x berolinensis]